MHKKPVTRTFRIEHLYDEALREESEKSGLSVNSLGNQIFKRYTEFDRYYEVGQLIILSPRTFEMIISNLEENTITEIARMLGSEIPRDKLLMRGMSINRKSLFWFIENILSNYYHWFSCDIHNTKNSSIFYLRHVYNIKWSHFLQNFFSAMFEELLQFNNINFTTTDLTVSFKIPI
jgi:hypothetical protein